MPNPLSNSNPRLAGTHTLIIKGHPQTLAHPKLLTHQLVPPLAAR